MGDEGTSGADIQALQDLVASLQSQTESVLYEIDQLRASFGRRRQGSPSQIRCCAFAPTCTSKSCLQFAPRARRMLRAMRLTTFLLVLAAGFALLGAVAIRRSRGSRTPARDHVAGVVEFLLALVLALVAAARALSLW